MMLMIFFCWTMPFYRDVVALKKLDEDDHLPFSSNAEENNRFKSSN